MVLVLEIAMGVAIGVLLALLSHENAQDGPWTRDFRPRRSECPYMKEGLETIGPSRTS